MLMYKMRFTIIHIYLFTYYNLFNGNKRKVEELYMYMCHINKKKNDNSLIFPSCS